MKNRLSIMRIAALTAVLISVAGWLFILHFSDSDYYIYLICACLGIWGSIYPIVKGEETCFIRCRVLSVISAGLFTTAVSAANYSLFWFQDGLDQTYYPDPIDLDVPKIILFAILFITGFIISYSFVSSFLRLFDGEDGVKLQPRSEGCRKVFWIVFAVLSVIYLAFLYLVTQPGVITSDTTWLLEMIDTGSYSRHHPYYYTKLLECGIRAAYLLGLDRNAGILIFATVQALLLALMVAYMVETLYERGFAMPIVIAAALVYALIPCHIVSAAGIQKDFLFSGGTLIFTVSLYRYLTEMGVHRRRDIVLIILGAVMMALLRNNGWVVLAATFVVMVITLRKDALVLYPALIVILLVTFVMNHQVLDALGVSNPRAQEGLAVPGQQMARVAAAHRDFSQEDLDEYNRFIQVNLISENYKPHLYDPVKAMIDETKLADNMGDYLALWLRMLPKYPADYFKAYVDLTRGFWNGGYDYLRTWEVGNTDYEIRWELGWSWPPAVKAWEIYTDAFFGASPLRIVNDVGAMVWLLVMLGVTALYRRDRRSIALLAPYILAVGTVLCSTPLCYQLRYIYLVYYTMPFLVPVVIKNRV